MKSYVTQQRKPTDYIVAVVVAVLAMGLVIYALARHVVDKAETSHAPLQTRVIAAAASPSSPPPPPPPPTMVQPPPPYIPPPKIKLPSPPKPPMKHVSHQKPQKPQPPKPQQTPPTPQAPSANTSESDHTAGAMPINNVRPEYPQEAQEENREGTVTASCDIMEDGKPAHCKILSVKGGHDFAESAMDFLEHSPVRYQPAMAGGQPVVEHNHVLHLDFTLGDE